MLDGIISILVIAGLGIVCAAISYVDNRIVDKSGDVYEYYIFWGYIAQGMLHKYFVEREEEYGGQNFRTREKQGKNEKEKTRRGNDRRKSTKDSFCGAEYNVRFVDDFMRRCGFGRK
ncbi:MAG: hypothetical protein K2N43_07440 [Lachnospiraceae bacterium]|nr:hypothetical protein [Lachnospiraceae bacterium]